MSKRLCVVDSTVAPLLKELGSLDVEAWQDCYNFCFDVAQSGTQELAPLEAAVWEWHKAGRPLPVDQTEQLRHAGSLLEAVFDTISPGANLVAADVSLEELKTWLDEALKEVPTGVTPDGMPGLDYPSTLQEIVDSHRLPLYLKRVGGSDDAQLGVTGLYIRLDEDEVMWGFSLHNGTWNYRTYGVGIERAGNSLWRLDYDRRVDVSVEPKSGSAVQTFTDYAARTAETAIYPDAGLGTPKALSYCVHGLVGEVAEYMDEPSGDELGDIWWYVARLSVELTVVDVVEASFSQGSLGSCHPPAALLLVSARMSNAAKKLVRDGTEKATNRRKLLVALLRVVELLRIEGAKQGVSLSGCWTKNISKLESRKDRGVLQGSGSDR